MKILSLAVVTLAVCAPARAAHVRVGSKAFTESVILGEVVTQLADSTGTPAVHHRQLGGTRILWDALTNKQIDLYPEYTGTISQEILAGPEGQNIHSDADLRRALSRHDISMTESLGFNDTYAIGTPEETAARLNLTSLSSLKQHPELRLGLSNEFMDRKDGWPGLRQAYGLPQQPTGLDHDLAYRGLQSHAIDATDLYSTDAEIQYYHLRVLADDLHYFPAYRAVILYRTELETTCPSLVAALHRLEGRIPEPTMIAMNAAVKLDHRPESQVASDFLRKTLNLETTAGESSVFQSILQRTGEHLFLVLTSLTAAIVAGIPLGILAARRPRLGRVIIGTVSAVYTIPSLALLVFMIPLLGIGALPAIVALFLYSLLPIVRNTHAGLLGIPRPLIESAEVLGLPPRTRLWRIELPLALGPILAGIKTSAVINVGTATLGALIGAGGYGQPILTGVRLDSTPLILQGAIPAAVMALGVQAAFNLLERTATPASRGVRS